MDDNPGTEKNVGKKTSPLKNPMSNIQTKMLVFCVYLMHKSNVHNHK